MSMVEECLERYKLKQDSYVEMEYNVNFVRLIRRQHNTTTFFILPRRLSTFPRYSEVMNCCLKAVFPTPDAPDNSTL